MIQHCKLWTPHVINLFVLKHKISNGMCILDIGIAQHAAYEAKSNVLVAARSTRQLFSTEVCFSCVHVMIFLPFGFLYSDFTRQIENEWCEVLQYDKLKCMIWQCMDFEARFLKKCVLCAYVLLFLLLSCNFYLFFSLHWWFSAPLLFFTPAISGLNFHCAKGGSCRIIINTERQNMN